MQHPRLYRFITVLGTILLIMFFAILYQKNFSSESTFASLSSIPFFTPIFWFCLPGGAVLLTAGIWGIGKQDSKGNGSLFALYAIQLIVACIFFLYIFMSISVPVGL